MAEMKRKDIISAASIYGKRFQNWLEFILQWECVYNKDGNIITENVPGDGGGLTFAGIDQRSHPHFNYLSPSAREIASIYYKDYWKPSHAELMTFPVGEVVANFSVNTGKTRAARILQSAINMTPDGGTTRVDGVIGLKTIEAANKENPAKLADLIEDVASDFYRGLATANSKNKKFLNGWLNRNAALEKWWMFLISPA